MPASTPRSDSPFEDPRQRIEAGRFGMWVFLIVLGVFFAAAMIAFAAIRIDLGSSPLWGGAGAPPLPHVLYASTAALALVSGVLEMGCRRARRGCNPRAAEWVASFLGLVFLALQASAWQTLWRSGLVPTSDLYGWSFYVLTGVHAAHVVGGIVFLFWILGRGSAGSSTGEQGGTLRLAAMYWHFLGIAWIGFFGLLVWSRP